MNCAIKIRIYPDKEQRIQIEKTIGCSRFIYNQMLADKISYYQKEKKMLRNTPAGYKKEISLAEGGGLPCPGECAAASGKCVPEVFPGTILRISPL